MIRPSCELSSRVSLVEGGWRAWGVEHRFMRWDLLSLVNLGSDLSHPSGPPCLAEAPFLILRTVPLPSSVGTEPLSSSL